MQCQEVTLYKMFDEVKFGAQRLLFLHDNAYMSGEITWPFYSVHTVVFVIIEFAIKLCAPFRGCSTYLGRHPGYILLPVSLALVVQLCHEFRWIAGAR